MNKCMIFYVSQHHHNTERLLKQAIDKESGVELVPLSHAACPAPDLSDTACSSLSRSAAFPTAPLLPSPASCPLIGLASGIYMGIPPCFPFWSSTGRSWPDERFSSFLPADPE